MSVSLGPADLRVTADGREYKRQSRNQLLQAARDLGFNRPGFEAVVPTFQPAEGLGVFSYDGPVQVRAARLTADGPR